MPFHELQPHLITYPDQPPKPALNPDDPLVFQALLACRTCPFCDWGPGKKDFCKAASRPLPTRKSDNKVPVTVTLSQRRLGIPFIDDKTLPLPLTTGRVTITPAFDYVGQDLTSFDCPNLIVAGKVKGPAGYYNKGIVGELTPGDAPYTLVGPSEPIF